MEHQIKVIPHRIPYTSYAVKLRCLDCGMLAKGKMIYKKPEALKIMRDHAEGNN